MDKLLLVAGVNPFEAMGRNFRGEYAEFRLTDFLGLAILLAIVGGASFVLWRFLAREECDKPYFKPRRLFRELCDVHQLDTATRALLRDLARAHGMSQPAMLFLQRERFRTDKLDAGWKARRGQLEALAAQLFAVAPAEQSSPATAKSA